MEENTGQNCPCMSQEETDAYSRFSQEISELEREETGEKFAEADPRVKEADIGWIQAIQFVITIKKLLASQGVQDFIQRVAPRMYDILQRIEAETGQVLSIARALLDGILQQNPSGGFAAAGPQGGPGWQPPQFQTQQYDPNRPAVLQGVNPALAPSSGTDPNAPRSTMQTAPGQVSTAPAVGSGPVSNLGPGGPALGNVPIPPNTATAANPLTGPANPAAAVGSVAQQAVIPPVTSQGGPAMARGAASVSSPVQQTQPNQPVPQPAGAGQQPTEAPTAENQETPPPDEGQDPGVPPEGPPPEEPPPADIQSPMSPPPPQK